MSQIAVDVVVLPDDAMTKRAITVNRELAATYGSEIVLDAENCLPHISLAMGSINESDVNLLQTWLEELARRAAVRTLRALGIGAATNARGQTVSAFEIEKTPELQALHENVMEKVEPVFRSDATEAMILDDTVAESTLEWIRSYREKASFGRFQPHITIGYGQVTTAMAFPLRFEASRLALCHLGNHCTCRKVLASAPIS
jgi:2'-5' RNA ligase